MIIIVNLWLKRVLDYIFGPKLAPLDDLYLQTKLASLS